MKSLRAVGSASVAATIATIAMACSSSFTEEQGVATDDAGLDGAGVSASPDSAARVDAGGVMQDARADANDGAPGGSFCAQFKGQPSTYCTDFEDQAIGPTPSPHTFGGFASSTRDPLDRAEWDVVGPGRVGRLRVAEIPDGGIPAAVRGALEVDLATRPKRVDCTLSWMVTMRAPATTAMFPENIALVGLVYANPGFTEVPTSLVTSASGPAQIFQPSLLVASARAVDVPSLEGLGWRSARVTFDMPLPEGSSSFIQVSSPLAPTVSAPFTVPAGSSAFRILIGPDYVSTNPWEVLFDDVVCVVTP